MKQAVLVLGPESSGLYLMTNLLIGCGYVGNTGDPINDADEELQRDIDSVGIENRNEKHYVR